MWFVFAGMGTQWVGMGRDLMQVDVFKKSIMKSDALLRPYGIELYNMLMTCDENTFENTLNSFVGIAAIQVWKSILFLSVVCIVEQTSIIITYGLTTFLHVYR